MPTLYLCVCATNFPAQALLRLRDTLRNTPVAVLEGNPPQERVCSINSAAGKLGVRIGMTRVEAETLAGAQVLRRNPAEEAQAREAALECAGRFSPSIENPSENAATFLCILDISGTEKLFGHPGELAQKLRTELTRIGIHTSLAVSENYHAAVARARACSGISILPAGQEQKSLSKLPLGVLDLSEAHTTTLHLWGIRNLGALAALPEIDLITRFGQQGKRMLELARGTHPHHFRPVELRFELKETFTFETPVEMLDSLLFVLGPMLDQLILRAQGYAQSLASITVTFLLDTRTETSTETRTEADPQTQPAEHIRTIRPALATGDRKLLLKLLQLDMEAHPPAAAVTAITLQAETGEASKVQLGLFSPQLPEASRLDVTLARLAAIVGPDRVGSPQLEDTHQPDSFRNTPFSVPAKAGHTKAGNAKAGQTKASHAKSDPEEAGRGTRPALRRIRPPQPLQLQLIAEQPGSFAFRNRSYIVRAAYGPWKEGGAWWSAGRWSREEWDIMAETQEKDARLCCLITHDLLRRQWLIEALYD